MTRRSLAASARTATATPTIRQAIDAYAGALPAKRRRGARLGLELLKSHLNNYAYELLDGAERREFDRLYDAEGAAHREYCEIFGREKIVPQLRHFLGWS